MGKNSKAHKRKIEARRSQGKPWRNQSHDIKKIEKQAKETGKITPKEALLLGRTYASKGQNPENIFNKMS